MWRPRGTKPYGRGIRRAALLLAVTAAWAIGSATTAQASLTDLYPSNDCESGAGPGVVVFDGWVFNNYYTVRTAKDPSDANKDWVCFAVQNATGGVPAHFGGKVVVQRPAADAVAIDNQSEACEGAGTDLFHEGGAVRDVPFDLRVTRVPGAGVAGQIWVCASANNGTIDTRVKVDTDLAGASFEQDPPTTVAYPSPAGPAGYPSSSCESQVLHVREINAQVRDHRDWLYTKQTGTDRIDVCVRAQPLAGSGPAVGGILTLDTTGIAQLGSDQSSDFSPCTDNELTLSDPPIQLRNSRPGASPAWVCVQAGTTYRRVQLSALSGGLPARFTPDP
jgi:hypothetical protein